ncbi:MAG: flippase-like domain-containing protein [Chloroflexota bacterium]|nr:flippase-like domain-containing protein [Chloroflexota bacterium]
MTPEKTSETPNANVGSSAWRRITRIPTPVIFVGSLALAIAVLFLTGSLDGIVSALGNADVSLLLLTAPIYVGSLWLLAFRWHLLVQMAGGVPHLPRAAEAFLTSVVINYAAPVGLAVPSRAALTKRALGLDASQTGTIALWEIAFDVLILGLGTVLWLVLAEGALGEVRAELARSSGSYVLAGVAMFVLVAMAALIVSRRPSLKGKLIGIMGRIVIAPRRRPAAAVRTLLVTLAYWILQGVVLWMIITALAVDVSATFMIGFTSLPILVGMLSPIPGGAAVREGLMYVIARLSGLDSEADAILAAALIYRFALFGAIPLLFALNRIWLNRSPHSPETPNDERMPIE